MCQRLIVATIYPHLMRRVIAKPLPKFLIMSFAGAERNYICSCRQNFTGCTHYEIDAFLRRQSGDVRDDRAVEVDGQMKPFEDVPFTLSLPFQVFSVEARDQIRVTFGIPNFVIDTVGNS